MATFRVTTPDGSQYEITADNDAAVQAAVNDLMAQVKPTAANKQEAEKKPEVSKLASGAVGLAQGATANFGDEIGAALDIPVSDIFSGKAGETYGKNLDTRRASFKKAQEANPGTYLMGELGGALAAPVPGMGVARGASLGARMAAGARGGATYGVLAGAGSGEGADGRLTGALTGGIGGAVVGGALPAVGAGIGKAYNASVRPQVEAALGAIAPNNIAAKQTARAIAADAGRGEGLSRAEFNAAAARGEPVIAADMGGTNTQALLRSATNNSPEAHATLKAPLEARLASQRGRVADDIDDMTIGKTNPQKMSVIEDEATKANSPLYKTAHAEGDRDIWNKGLARLMESTLVQEAMKRAVKRVADHDIANGLDPARSRIDLDDAGNLVFGKLGIPAFPNLKLWDYARRELSDMGYGAQADPLAKKIAGQLNALLDREVPSYAKARASAAKFKGAETATEAGAMAAKRGTMTDSEIVAMQRAMNPGERKLFRDAFKVAIADEVRRQGLSKIYDGRADAHLERRLRAALGKEAQQVQARLAFEAIMQKTKDALGNSTTARQLMELGMTGGVSGLSTAYYTGDVSTGVSTGLAMAGVRRAQQAGNRKVAERVAEILVSKNPDKLLMLQKQAANSPAYMKTLTNIARGLAAREAGAAGGEAGAASPLMFNLGAPRLGAASEHDERKAK